MGSLLASCSTHNASGAADIGDSGNVLDAAKNDAIAPDIGTPITDSSSPDAATQYELFLDIPYAMVSGVDPNLLSLDIMVPSAPPSGPRPVVVWTHGGGWAYGDKSNQMADKRRLFASAGYVLVSINYRLSPDPPNINDPERVMFPTHPEDVAQAIAWTIQNIEAYGGDSTRLAVMGHSAGAHLVALVGLSDRFLGKHNLPLSSLSCVLPIDTSAFDINTLLEPSDPERDATYWNAFGSDPLVWREASPIAYASQGNPPTSFFLVERGTAARRQQLQALAQALRTNGHQVTVIDASIYTHQEVNQAIGSPEDVIVTDQLMAFLRLCFSH